MKISLVISFFLCAMVQSAFATLALAATTPWAETPGAAMRIQIVPPASDSKVLEGLLEVRLDEGWKTYWREPGDGGIPPFVFLKTDANPDGQPLELRYPVPQRLLQGDVHLAGYKDGVQFPFSVAIVDLPENWYEEGITIGVFLGVCSDICVPFAEDFQLGFANDIPTGVHPESLSLAIANTKMPKAMQNETDMPQASVKGEALIIEIASGIKAQDIFLVNADGYYFGRPVLSQDGAQFEVPIMNGGAENAEVDYVIRSADGGYSGTFMLEK